MIRLRRHASGLGFGMVLLAAPLSAQLPNNLTVTSSTPAPYQANQTITTSGTVTVSGGGTVAYQAGQSITLLPGFTAIAGSSGTAFIAQMVAPTFTVTSSAAPTLGIGQSVSFPVTITPEFGFAGTVTPSVPSLPTGFGVAFSPTSVSFSNSNPATVTVTLTLGSTATTGSHSLTIQGGSLAGQMVSVPVTVTALPAPVISLASPANGADIWGQVDLSGYALVNTPGFRACRRAGRFRLRWR